jgi:FkbM family methyltransferase
MQIRKRMREFIALPALQPLYRLVYRAALVGMNYGGASSSRSSGDAVALELVARSPRRPVHVFDVGASVGEYSRLVLEQLEGNVRLWSFEPSSASVERLRALVGNAGAEVVHAAVAETTGTGTLLSDVAGSVHASLFPNPLGVRDGGTQAAEHVATVSLDDFCAQQGVDRIDLLKIDVEGGELAVLRGAKELLDRRAIGMIQFEFGQPSIGAKVNFYDLYSLLVTDFRLFRVLPRGLAPIEAYHESMEVFLSTNYLAVRR